MKNKILSALRDSIKELKEKELLLQQAFEEPKLILTSLFNPELHQPYYDLYLKAIESKDLRYHEIQSELSKRLIEYLQQFDSEVEIINTGSSYPARFRITYEGKQFLSFDMYNHVFGDFRNLNSIKWFEDDIKYNLEEIEELRNKIDYYKKVRDNLFVVLKEDYEYKRNSLDLIMRLIKSIYLITVKRKNIKRNLSTMIEDIYFKIERLENKISEHKEKIENEKVLAPKLEEKYQEWRERFVNWGYEEKERKYSGLY